VAAGSPVIALCRLDPGHLHIPGDRRATAGLAAVAAGHVIGGIAGLLATTTANHVLAASQVGLAALTLLALPDLSARSTGNPAMGTS
jgi:phage tail protein X